MWIVVYTILYSQKSSSLIGKNFLFEYNYFGITISSSDAYKTHGTIYTLYKMCKDKNKMIDTIIYVNK